MGHTPTPELEEEPEADCLAFCCSVIGSTEEKDISTLVAFWACGVNIIVSALLSGLKDIKGLKGVNGVNGFNGLNG